MDIQKFYKQKSIEAGFEDLGHWIDCEDLETMEVKIIQWSQEWHETKKELDKSSVSNRRELLNNFCSWLNEQYSLNIPPDESDVDRYIKNYQ